MAAGESDPVWPGIAPAAGRLLIAAPMLSDPSFHRAVVYLLEHDDSGTIGVTLNRPSHTPVGQVLPDWEDAVSDPQVVYNGGPVQQDGALCLGELTGGTGSGIRPLAGGICTVDLDADVDTITAITGRLRVFAGHSGWAAGQLADELGEGAWFVVDGFSNDVFSEQPDRLWRQVLRRQPAPLRLVSSYPEDPTLN